ncbi:MAG: precorrin-3B C(17)-methyltransferase [Pseudomonadota bacterium]
MADPTPAVICLDDGGAATAARAAEAIGGAVHRLGRGAGDTAETIQGLFTAGCPIVGVCAAGILIRLLGPVLGDKRAEPPVLAISADGASVVPLLGGHRGANRLARDLAAALGGHAALTTAGDVQLGIALDEPPPGWRLANPGDAKAAAAALLAGAGLRREGMAPWPSLSERDGPNTVTLIGTEAPAAGGPDRLVYHPQAHVLGLGASRHCPVEEMQALVATTLAEAGIAPGSIACVASIDLKMDEAAIQAVAAQLDVPARFFDAETLERETPRLATPSDTVFAEVGCHGVAEGAALAAAGTEGQLVVAKRRTAHATCAVARAPMPLATLPGQRRGHLAVVGIGPGGAAWRTAEATRLIASTDLLVGYGPYLDLLGPLATGKARRDFPLGEEEVRCRFALEEAGRGQRVALISSGDAGIYAMGALVMELLARGDAPDGVSQAARRAEVTHAAGITAMQAASAMAGALLGHDFCAISLSDLLTPRDDILRRLRAAAAGDFVVGLYNPVSQRRRTLLAAARDILLEARPAETPVLLARQVGRPDATITRRTLATLREEEVDMLTIVLIGASTSQVFETGEGWRMFTPRGYAVKRELA